MGSVPALLCAIGLSILAGQATAQPAAPKSEKRAFLTVRGTQLTLEGKPYRNVGANIPDLFEKFLLGSDAEGVGMLENAHKAGIRFARCFGATWGPEHFDIFEKDRTRWIDAYDRMLAAADKSEIAVVPSLLFNMNMIPEYIRKTTGRDEQAVNFLTPGTPSNNLAVAYVTAIVSRYGDDRRILFWEIGNEYNLDSDLSGQWKKRPANQIPTSDNVHAFLVQIASLIKSLDKNHPVTSGNADMRSYAWHIRHAMLAHRGKPDPNDYPMDWRKDTFAQYTEMLAFFNPKPLDIICIHQYPPGKDFPGWLTEDDDRALQLVWSRRAADKLKKPLFAGEFGQKTYADGKEQPSLWTKDYLRQLKDGAAPIGALWAWQYRENEPGVSPYLFSPTFTPELVRLLTETNAALAR